MGFVCSFEYNSSPDDDSIFIRGEVENSIRPRRGRISVFATDFESPTISRWPCVRLHKATPRSDDVCVVHRQRLMIRPAKLSGRATVNYEKQSPHSFVVGASAVNEYQSDEQPARNYIIRDGALCLFLFILSSWIIRSSEVSRTRLFMPLTTRFDGFGLDLLLLWHAENDSADWKELAGEVIGAFFRGPSRFYAFYSFYSWYFYDALGQVLAMFPNLSPKWPLAVIVMNIFSIEIPEAHKNVE